MSDHLHLPYLKICNIYAISHDQSGWNKHIKFSLSTGNMATVGTRKLAESSGEEENKGVKNTFSRGKRKGIVIMIILNLCNYRWFTAILSIFIIFYLFIPILSFDAEFFYFAIKGGETPIQGWSYQFFASYISTVIIQQLYNPLFLISLF